MSSNMQYTKICQYCGKEFTAQKSITRCCSHRCASLLYKEEQRRKRRNEEQDTIVEQRRQSLLNIEYLSITQAAALLGVSRPTIYKLIASGQLPAQQLTQRTIRIRRADIDAIAPPAAPAHATTQQQRSITDTHLTCKQAMERYSISEAWFYKKVKAEGLQPALVGGKAYYPPRSLDKLFQQKKHADIVEWYTVAQICQQFNLTTQTVYEYTSTHRIPKKKQGSITLISKQHWDTLRGLSPADSQSYYSVDEATQRYNITRSHLYDLARQHKLPKLRKGKYVYIHRQSLDDIMNKRKNR